MTLSIYELVTPYNNQLITSHLLIYYKKFNNDTKHNHDECKKNNSEVKIDVRSI